MAVTPADQDQAFLREVDENLRADQLAEFGRRWGKALIAAIVVGLIALAGWLWWQNHSRNVAGEQGEQLQAAFNDIAANRDAAAAKPLEELSKSRVDGYKAAALMSQAVIAVDKNDPKTAVSKLKAVADDSSLAKPYRDLALVKQTMIEFDQLQPQAVIDRLKPLAVKDSAFLGTAGELVAVSYLRQGKRKEAGALFGQIAKDENVPETIRQRAVQMAGVLGVDAIDQNVSGTKQ